MNKLHKTVAAAAVLATLGVGSIGAHTVFAQGVTQRTNNTSALVTGIATKFNLNVQDVQAVFDAQRTARQAEHTAALDAQVKTRLAELVKNGKLTQVQSDAIIAKQAEMKTFLASLEGKTPAEKQAALKTQMTALTNWAKANAIPQQYLNIGRGFGGFGHAGKGPLGGKMGGGMMHRR